VGASAALSYAIVLHALNLVPYIVLGAVALGRLGIRTRELTAPADDIRSLVALDGLEGSSSDARTR